MLKKTFQDYNDRSAQQERAVTHGIRLPYRIQFAKQVGGYDAKMRERYFSFWDEMPITPQGTVEALCEGITGGPDDLVVQDMFFQPRIENDEIKGLRVETKFVPRGDLERDYGFAYLNNDRDYDFETGTCKNGDIRTKGLKQPGIGRRAVRNALQLGQALGCPKIELSATRTGCLLWLQKNAYDVAEVNPKYIDHVLKRWEEIEPYCSGIVDTANIKAAIEAGDLRALAAQDINIFSALAHTSGGVHKHHELAQDNGAIPLNRYLLIDTMIDCWRGHADMNNLEQRERLGELLGGWTSESLMPLPTALAISTQDFE